MTTPWLTDAELIDATHRRQPCAQARALAGMGVPFLRRPDGTLLVSRQALEAALSGATAGTSTHPPTSRWAHNAADAPASNGIRWSNRA